MANPAQPSQCPICAGELRPIPVAPCFDCGHVRGELKECKRGEHEYNVWQLWGQELVLCDFCDADFDSYTPVYWGLADKQNGSYPLQWIRKVERPRISEDLYCPNCKHRLAFLLFRQQALRFNGASEPDNNNAE
ncbi:hypothetical protein HC231_14370 [Brenneria izadpanahii]|uniref:HNH endonuclease n=1 Tax=Brenneria izadpanahii TaxID=2722756 RepID=A0ABX7UXA5_9GAMM|nr:hypothetical protein [Brenneria izadpanahii]QTF08962.1 hypothetical protein HC231_14370 [Brenneria izadpanahii]